MTKIQPKQSPDYIKIFIDYAGSGLGVYKITSAFKKMIEWPLYLIPNKLGIRNIQKFNKAIGVLNKAASVSVLTKFMGTVHSLGEALSKYRNSKTTEESQKASEKLFKEGADFVGDVTNIFKLTNLMRIMNLGKTSIASLSILGGGCSMIVDAIELRKSAEDLRASSLKVNESKDKAKVQKETEKQRLAMINIARKSMSFVASVFSVIIPMIFGTTLIPLVFIMALSTFSLFGSFWAEFYDKSRTEVLEKAHQIKQVEARFA